MSAHIKPCLIVSSARSGSKLLRELLMQSNQFRCYPYDINYVWMKGNTGRKDDELSISDFKEENAKFIRDYLGKLTSGSNNEQRILEKTVSNALRLEYVLRVLPDAQIIHLVRDGREVTASIRSCWTQPAYSEKNQSRKLLFEKLVAFPFSSAGPYLVKYLKNNLFAMFGGKSVSSWGPRFQGIDKMLAEKPLISVCAQQWARSLELTSNVLQNRSSDKYIEVKYESLIGDPSKTINELCRFLSLNDKAENEMSAWASENFRESDSCWNTKLTEDERLLVMPILERELLRVGYL